MSRLVSESLRTELMIVRQGLGMKLKKLKENQTNIAALIKDIQRSSFKIKDGPYEVRKCSVQVMDAIHVNIHLYRYNIL